MRIIPVLDILNGQVVRGIAGDRQQYRPIQSLLADGSDPITIAEAIRIRYGFDHFYLADLDAIMGKPASVSLYRALLDRGFRLTVDAGIQTAEQAQTLLQAGVTQLVAGLETLDHPRELASLVNDCSAERTVVSVDLKGGRLLSSTSWPTEIDEVITLIVDSGVHKLILLDLARVGTGRGVGTTELARRCLERYPNVELILGGGVRGIEDLQRLKDLGVAGVLVASILYDRTVTTAQLQSLTGDN